MYRSRIGTNSVNLTHSPAMAITFRKSLITEVGGRFQKVKDVAVTDERLSSLSSSKAAGIVSTKTSGSSSRAPDKAGDSQSTRISILSFWSLSL